MKNTKLFLHPHPPQYLELGPETEEPKIQPTVYMQMYPITL